MSMECLAKMIARVGYRSKRIDTYLIVLGHDIHSFLLLPSFPSPPFPSPPFPSPPFPSPPFPPSTSVYMKTFTSG